MQKILLKLLFIIFILPVTIFAEEDEKFDVTLPAKIQHTTPEFVYKFLLAEIAAQRGDLNSAGHIYLDLAKLTKDLTIARRATDIAGFARNGRLAMDSAQVWSELDQNSIEAKQILAELLIASGNLAKAKPLIEELLQKEQTRADGFLYLNGLLAKVENKKNALRFIINIAKPYPKLAEAHFSIAHAAFFAGDKKLAKKELNIVNSLKPDWQTAALFQGFILSQEWPEKAVEFYRNYLEKYPDANEVRLEYAKVLTSLKKFALAKQEFLKLVNGSLASPEISLTVALLAVELEDSKLAEEYLNQSLERGYNQPDRIYLYLARIHDERGEAKKALSYLDKVASGEFFMDAKLYAAEIISKSQSVDDAVNSLDQYKNLNEQEKLKFLQAKTALYFNNNRAQDAWTLMAKEEENFKNVPEFKFDYALLSEKMGNTLLMEQLLKEAIKLKPDYALAYNALGYSYADRNIKLQEAKKYIEIALSIQPNNHYILDSMGWVYFRLGDLDIAYQFVKKAYDIKADPEIAAHLGEILWKQGKQIEAKRIWNESLTINPSNTVLVETSQRLQ
ncbi:MAG: tetratricopeptide repeat protein [Methylophilaceae bacterium]|nr:tetratricopeptide repeat protein [Methylophilaceae bacterium]MBL6726295.1 tetratricopeptide repeat protein [Methylophilaceae bacterium]MBL6728111.1 tetratricopeptide repeat protein [Methylophilaceae bacterium]MBL6790514.1 tetratricopeptide repeat protein [Methylophilaceae bacterium]